MEVVYTEPIIMEDRELRNLLLETCPVRPGQESRAWSGLREQLYAVRPENSGWSSVLTSRGWTGIAVALALLLIVGGLTLNRVTPNAIATADSQSPGIYATAFYSNSAKAQVVWLNGMEPATDKLTYLDPTTVIAGATDNAPATGDPNSL